MAELVDDAVVAHGATFGRPGGAEQVLGQPERGQGLQHRHLDHLALAGAFAVIERAQHGDAEMEPGGLVGDQAGHEARRQAVDPRLQRGGAAHALHQIVEGGLVAVGALAGIAQRVGVDDRGIDLLQIVVAQAQALDRRRPAVVDEEVGRPDQLLQHGAGGRLLEVEAERALVAVGRHVDRPHALVAPHRAARHAQQIAFRRLDLDHVGAHVGHVLGSERAQQHGREIDHAYAFERSRHLSFLWIVLGSHYGTIFLPLHTTRGEVSAQRTRRLHRRRSELRLALLEGGGGSRPTRYAVRWPRRQRAGRS